MKPFRFTAEHFSRSELQRKFGEDAPWFYERLAQIANSELEAHEATCERVTGYIDSDFGNYVFMTDDTVSEPTHTALLWNVEKIGGGNDTRKQSDDAIATPETEKDYCKKCKGWGILVHYSKLPFSPDRKYTEDCPECGGKDQRALRDFQRPRD